MGEADPHKRAQTPPASKSEFTGNVFNFGPQHGIVSIGSHNVIEQTVAPGKDTNATPSATTASSKAELPHFQSEGELGAFLQNWVRGQWKSQADGGTGRSGNAIIKCLWRGQAALLKVSADAAGLGREAMHLAALREQGVGLSVARLFARAGVTDGDDRWMAYLMEPVGEMSLRDYLFTATPSPGGFIESLRRGLSALYVRTGRLVAQPRYVQEYLQDIRKCLGKARGYATFAGLAGSFDTELAIKGVALVGPGRILKGLEERLEQGDPALLALNPAQDCHVHGDLHFENIRVNPNEADLGTHWLIDPKEFDRGDYVYDLAKLLTSLTGHAHADIGENEKGNPRLTWTASAQGRIDFNCILTARQVAGWREALAALEPLATGVALRLESAPAGSADSRVRAVMRMKQRLLLALARHYFSAVRYFLKREAQWLLFARGAQFLAMFQAALAEGPRKAPAQWDVFQVCASDAWLETV